MFLGTQVLANVLGDDIEIGLAAGHDHRKIRPFDHAIDVGFCSDLTPKGYELIAESSGDGNLVTTLRTTTIQHGCAGLGLHAGKEAVGLGAVTAVRLEGTLRHDKTPAAGEGSRSNF